jgi:hypothetical protein
MNDAGARERGQCRRMVEKRVQQRPVAIAAAGMHDQSRRLVDDQNGVVFVHDRELDRLRGVGNRPRFNGHIDDDPLSAAESLLTLGDRAVERDTACIDPILEPAPRMLGTEPRERLVEAQPGELGRHRKLERTSVSSSRSASRAPL